MIVFFKLVSLKSNNNHNIREFENPQLLEKRCLGSFGDFTYKGGGPARLICAFKILFCADETKKLDTGESFGISTLAHYFRELPPRLTGDDWQIKSAVRRLLNNDIVYEGQGSITAMDTLLKCTSGSQRIRIYQLTEKGIEVFAGKYYCSQDQLNDLFKPEPIYESDATQVSGASSPKRLHSELESTSEDVQKSKQPCVVSANDSSALIEKQNTSVENKIVSLKKYPCAVPIKKARSTTWGNVDSPEGGCGRLKRALEILFSADSTKRLDPSKYFTLKDLLPIFKSLRPTLTLGDSEIRGKINKIARLVNRDASWHFSDYVNKVEAFSSILGTVYQLNEAGINTICGKYYINKGAGSGNVMDSFKKYFDSRPISEARDNKSFGDIDSNRMLAFRMETTFKILFSGDKYRVVDTARVFSFDDLYNIFVALPPHLNANNDRVRKDTVIRKIKQCIFTGNSSFPKISNITRSLGAAYQLTDAGIGYCCGEYYRDDVELCITTSLIATNSEIDNDVAEGAEDLLRLMNS